VATTVVNRASIDIAQTADTELFVSFFMAASIGEKKFHFFLKYAPSKSLETRRAIESTIGQ
jgi:hypothetical protein